MATTSACAVGSLVAVTRFAPVATVFPQGLNIAPNGSPPPAVAFSLARAIAFSIKTGLPCIRLGILIARFTRRESRDNQIMAHAFLSNRVVTPQGTQPAALLVEDGKIRAICRASELPADTVLRNCGSDAILPGLVDTHVHINQPGRTEWEGFRTATRAAAAGGYTTLVDMPLNCLPETTTVAALEAKRNAAAGQCRVDWAAWGGLTGQNQEHIAPLAAAGVAGFKCFLVDPGIAGLALIEAQELEAAAPALARSGLPLLVHAELAEFLYQGGDQDYWRQYATWLRSRPDESELAAIRVLIGLCRKYRFRLHIVHVATG